MVTFMRVRFLAARLAAVLGMVVAVVPHSQAQDQPPVGSQAPTASQQPQTQESFGREAQGRGRPLFGKISAIRNDALEITTQDGNKVSLKLDAKTEFRKERQPAKIRDFKVGDAVIVRTNQESENSSVAAAGATAVMVAAVPAGFAGRGGASGPGGSGGMLGAIAGTLGKDYLVGEVKSLDPPKLTILRTDNVTQTIELNEETSLRRGRESITMADIQPADHVFVRGAMANDVFVPKGLNVIPHEQWMRLQEMNAGRGAHGAAAPQNAPAATPSVPPSQQAPPEPRN
jgi:Domain of unknown function (DUF5666)